MAEISRIQYEMEYAEGIKKLKVAPPNADLDQGFQEGVPNASVIMQVPERIVVTGNNEAISFSRPADLDLIQSTPFKPLALKIPPRRPLDFLDLERLPPTPQNEEIQAVGRLKRERSMSKNAVRQNGQLYYCGSGDKPGDLHMCGISNIDAVIEGALDDMTVVDAASLRQEENKERAKREMVMYSITVAFWLLNSWLWFRR
uniref:Mitochondrial fission factor n=1 Tax=Cricetulus griseus TaxID=10029 RepID=A0A8C2N3D2_CRIGR